jgi:hypothetical protein
MKELTEDYIGYVVMGFTALIVLPVLICLAPVALIGWAIKIMTGKTIWAANPSDAAIDTF